MTQVVIYKTDEGTVTVLNPSQEALQQHTLLEIAKRDVPAGKPFKIVDKSELPSWEFQDAWDVDEVDLTDGVGSSTTDWENL